MKFAALRQRCLRKELALCTRMVFVVFAKHWLAAVDSFGMQMVSCNAPAK
jgi:hypothetical protein